MAENQIIYKITLDKTLIDLEDQYSFSYDEGTNITVYAVQSAEQNGYNQVNFADYNRKLWYFPNCDSIEEDQPYIDFIRIKVADNLFLSVAEFNEHINKYYWLQQSYKIYITTFGLDFATLTINFKVEKESNVNGYFYHNITNDDLLQPVSRELFTIVKWGKNNTNIYKNLAIFPNNWTLKQILDAIGTSADNNKTALLMPKTRSYLKDTVDVLRKYIKIPQTLTNKHYRYQIDNQKLPGYQLKLSAYDDPTHNQPQTWSLQTILPYMPVKTIAAPLIYITYTTNLNDIDNWDTDKIYLIAKISNQYLSTPVNSRETVHFINNNVIWPQYTITPKETNINYSIRWYDDYENIWTTIPNLPITNCIKWKEKTLNIEYGNCEHIINITLPALQSGISKASRSKDLYEDLDWDLNEEALPLFFTGGAYGETEFYKTCDIYYSTLNQDGILKLTTQKYTESDFNNFHWGFIETGTSETTWHKNSYHGQPFFTSLRYWFNYNFKLPTITIVSPTDYTTGLSSWFNQSINPMISITIPSFGANNDRYITQNLIHGSTEILGQTCDMYITLNRSIPNDILDDDTRTKIASAWENPYNTLSIWYSHDNGSSFDYFSYNLSTTRNNSNYLYYIFEVDLV